MTLSFLDPEGSLNALTVVLVVALLLRTGGVVTRFRKMPKALFCLLYTSDAADE